MTSAGGDDRDYTFTYEPALHDAFPALYEAEREWLAQIDSLTEPDRKTHELVRLTCSVIQRNDAGIERHAQLAAEVGATWGDIAGTIMLTQPAFGMWLAVAALPPARRGYERARPPETE